MSKDSLWKQVTEQKHISPCTFMERLGNIRRNIKIVSNQWKILELTFPIIGNIMAWTIENGEQVRLGFDYILGSGDTMLLPIYDLV